MYTPLINLALKLEINVALIDESAGGEHDWRRSSVYILWKASVHRLATVVEVHVIGLVDE